MELGNLLYGNSRGAYPVPREDAWENCFNTLLKLIDGPRIDGYGTEFSCPVFEIHRYYWGDCTCGFEEAEYAWSQSNQHAPTCSTDGSEDCPCGYFGRYARWVSTHAHDQACPIIRPNFAYAPMGFTLKWYKYPFRDAYMSHPLTFSDFRTMINACITWVRDHPHAVPNHHRRELSHTHRCSAGAGR